MRNWWIQRARDAFKNWSYERSPDEDFDDAGLIGAAFLAGARWQAQTETCDRDYLEATRVDFDTPRGDKKAWYKEKKENE